MFARKKRSGKYEYLQVVENRRENGKVKQDVIATIGRFDRLQAKGQVETLVRSLSRFSENILMILSARSDPNATAVKIGPALIFERLWQELGIRDTLRRLLDQRWFSFDVERAVFLTVVHRLLVSGSDRFCDKWRRDYRIQGTEGLQLHHLYRAMAWLGEPVELEPESGAPSVRCTKDLIEETMFLKNRNLFSSLDIVFFDTTSLFFQGEGGESLGERGFSKDHRPDLKQMVVGAVIDERGRPLCCELWPGNTSDAKTLVPVVERLRKRFAVGRVCIVADRGMISKSTITWLEDPTTNMSYILGTRMRSVNEVKNEVLSRAGSYQEVSAAGGGSKAPSPLKVKEVWVGENRYIVCLNPKQARKDAADREAIVAQLKKRIKESPKDMVGNDGFRRYLKFTKGSADIDWKKVKEEARYDGKWVLQTNTNLSAKMVALKYKELWQVEHLFRNFKSVLETRPIYHQRDDTIRGHVFCSFLAFSLKKEIYRRLENAGHNFEWSDIKQDLKALEEFTIEEDGKTLVVRTQCQGVCGKVFQAVGVAVPPTIREVK